LEQQNKQKNITLEEQTKLLEKQAADNLIAKENEIKHKRELENIALEQQLEAIKQEFKTRQIENAMALSKSETEYRLLTETQQINLDKVKYAAKSEQTVKAHELQLKIDDDKHLLDIKVQKLKAEIEKYRLEIQNLKNNQVLVSELIQELPRIAAEMPQISEMKVISTGSDDPVLANLTNFIAKISAVSESLGIKLTK